MLGIGSYLDLKKREVNDLLWIVFGGIGAALLLWQIQDFEFIYTMIFFLVFAVPLSLVFWRIGFFVGADAFAMMLIAFIAPIGLNGDVYPTTPFVNSLLILTGAIGVNFVRNLIHYTKNRNIFDGFCESRLRRTVAMAVGSTNCRYGFPMEVKTPKGRKFDFSLKHAEKTPFERRGGWMMVTFPFMVFISAGFVVQVLFGDIIFGWFG